MLDEDPVIWAARVVAESETEPLLRADDLPQEAIAELGQIVVEMVGDRRSSSSR